MLNALGPLLGCGLMLVVCLAAMAFAGRNRTASPDRPDPEVAELRDEVARLRAAADDRPAKLEEPTP